MPDALTTNSIRSIATILAVVLIDVVVIGGWAASIVVILWACFIVSRRRVAKERKLHWVAVALSGCLLATLLGYASTYYVQQDFVNAARTFNSRPPESMSGLLSGNPKMSWFTRYSLLSYSPATGVPLARFKLFPYKIVEYDFLGHVYRDTLYD